MYDFLIVGCGFTGAALAERIAAVLNKKVLIVEKRPHIGGNCYDYYDNSGVLVSKYGAHIFHTKDKNVWDYINKFTSFNDYVHMVDAKVGDSFYALPLNLNTINAFFNINLTSEEIPEFLSIKKVPINNPSNAEESVISQVGIELYEAFYKGYTLKQWGVEPKMLDASVTSRLPIRYNTDKRYFSDPWQGIPIGGYTKIFEKMLSHPNIEVLLNTDYNEIISTVKFNKLIFSGPIDLYFDHMFGKLPYRSINFQFETYDYEYYQHMGVVNFPNDFEYTRCTEYKYLNKQKHPKTTVSRDFPCWNDDEPYYPVPSPDSKIIYAKYKKEAEKLQNVIFGGRLGSYQYYNMDQCIGQALSIFKNKIADK